ncbi:MAG: FAD-dependent oxidoreductase [Phycisphaerae bacterium]|nr:FAD-dependent oxidoreductase [Phycisphaerae bacterium]
MDKTQRFSSRNLDELKQEIDSAGLDLPTSEDLSILAEEVRFGRLTVPNRLAVQPMEGCDCTNQGVPTDLTVRRYRRFAAGGAGLIWWEACAVVGEGRANPHQLWLHEGTVEAFAEMLAGARQAAAESVGHNPVCVLQLTHSGRYSRAGAAHGPVIAHHSPVLDPRDNLPTDYPLITDDQLDRLQDAYVRAAELAADAGFDAVDIKSCHGYLLSELLASFTRTGSRYGGSFENRTRMLRETAARIRRAVGDRIEVTTRMNAYDGIEYPYGWGVDKRDPNKVDLAEPTRLIGELEADGFGGVNITIGNPYFNPHVNRPADWMIADWPESPERPLRGVARIVHVVRDIQQANPGFPIVGSGYTWLRQYFPYFAAGLIDRGWASIVGLGRGALAYPDFAKDIFQTGRMAAKKVCVVCSSCTQIMRDGGQSGCVVRDHEIYAAIFRRGRRADPKQLRAAACECGECVDAMCTASCPAGVDIPAFLGALGDGREQDAYRILRDGNILGGICGAVCPAEQQCQGACIRNHLAGGSVPIAEIHRILAERAIEAGWAAIDVPDQASPHRVAVVGAGPAGLSAAAELLRLGHRVTILDRSREAGGKLLSVIPAERLDPSLARSEIHAIFDSVGADRLSWRFGTSLGPQLTLDDLAGEGFNAIALAVGLGGGVSLAGGDRPGGVIDGKAFLAQMNRNPGHACPGRVAVIGGGNTATDAGVLARRRGADDVYLIYRRSYEQMPAWPKDRDEALHAGVHLMLLCQPAGYVTDAAGKLTGVRAVRTQLAQADDSGRRRPVKVPNSEFLLGVDMAIEAIGERVDAAVAEVLAGVRLTDAGLILPVGETLATTRAGVWAAGDIVNGGATVVQAVAEGKRAAQEINVHLLGG